MKSEGSFAPQSNYFYYNSSKSYANSANISLKPPLANTKTKKSRCPTFGTGDGGRGTAGASPRPTPAANKFRQRGCFLCFCPASPPTSHPASHYVGRGLAPAETNEKEYTLWGKVYLLRKAIILISIVQNHTQTRQTYLFCIPLPWNSLQILYKFMKNFFTDP